MLVASIPLADGESMMELAVSISAACRLVGVQRTLMYQLIGRGAVEACKVGRRTLITRRSLDALIERGVEEATQARNR